MRSTDAPSTNRPPRNDPLSSNKRLPSTDLRHRRLSSLYPPQSFRAVSCISAPNGHKFVSVFFSAARSGSPLSRSRTYGLSDLFVVGRINLVESRAAATAYETREEVPDRGTTRNMTGTLSRHGLWPRLIRHQECKQPTVFALDQRNYTADNNGMLDSLAEIALQVSRTSVNDGEEVAVLSRPGGLP